MAQAFPLDLRVTFVKCLKSRFFFQQESAISSIESACVFEYQT